MTRVPGVAARWGISGACLREAPWVPILGTIVPRVEYRSVYRVPLT